MTLYSLIYDVFRQVSNVSLIVNFQNKIKFRFGKLAQIVGFGTLKIIRIRTRDLSGRLRSPDSTLDPPPAKVL